MNKQQKQAIQNAINKCKFPVVWDDKNKQRYIEVPTNHIDSWSDCMFASYLNRDFSFIIQQVIPGSVTVKSEFNPEMTERITNKEPIKEGAFFQPGKKYRVTYFREYSYTLELVRVVSGEYTWKNKNGSEITNKQNDVDKWLRHGEIEEI